MHFRRATVAVLVALLLGLAGGRGAAWAIEVWTPETGEVQLEQMPGDTVELRRKHALALVGTDEWTRGVAELRTLIEADPEGAWVAEARLAIARALLAAGRHRRAFDELEHLRNEDAEVSDGRVAAAAAQLQFAVARAAAAHDTALALRFYDRLAGSAPTREMKTYAQKERADALFAAGRYLEAEDEYQALADFYPNSEWVPYCWYKVADCKWALARWLRLGLEHLGEAGQGFRGFVGTYPAHANSEDAREKLNQVRQVQAAMYSKVARFHIQAQKKPWAAVNYLDYIREEFPDTSQAEWAARELETIRQHADAPLRGDTFPKLHLPGVTRQRPAQRADSAPSTGTE